MQEDSSTEDAVVSANYNFASFLYGCETWSLTLRKEHSLKVFDNRVLRKMYGTMMDEATGEWRKLHNEELHALLSSPNIVN